MPEVFRPTNTKLMVFGNGPSLRGFDFGCLEDVDSLGMNAAYRHWERIGWYPTHYVCLDDQLIETHADAINDLIVTSKVSTAFLISKILDYHPELIEFPNVFYLESFNRTRQTRVAGRGIKFIASNPFRESDPSKVTTGAYAVRFGAHLGYKEIAIAGVDLRYVEVIPEARHGDGIKLVMASTPSTNPNYFFDDYQRAGDKFNIPNPATHSRNLHIAAFELLAADAGMFEWDAKIVNVNRKSVLFDKGIFEYVPVSSFLADRPLAAVVVPTTEKELPTLLENLAAWSLPRLSPVRAKTCKARPDLIFGLSGDESVAAKAQLTEAFLRSPTLKRAFASVHVEFVGLSAQLDYYERDYTKRVTGKGFKSGPNEQFFELLNRQAGKGRFIFYMEADCIPIRQGWLDKLIEIAAGDSESWIIGSVYRGVEPIDPRFRNHLNGNSLYRVGDPEFIEFLNRFWRPQLELRLHTSDKRLAYDCLLSYEASDADSHRRNHQWLIHQETAHRFRATSLVQNLSGKADYSHDPKATLRRILAHDSNTYFVHGSSFLHLLHSEMDRARKANQPLQDLSWGEILGDYSTDDHALKGWENGQVAALPRLLIVDPIPTGSKAATGQIKEVFLDHWPSRSALQVYEKGGNLALQRFDAGSVSATAASMQQILQECREFNPEVIYLRPTDSKVIFDFYEQLVSLVAAPTVVHIMDDWPERLRYNDPVKFAQVDPMLRRALNNAALCLSICDAMSELFQPRYGMEFIPLANGVDIAHAPLKDWSSRGSFTDAKPMRIRYMGGLAKDMNFASVCDVAHAVSSLATEIPIEFEIYTMPWYMDEAEAAFKGIRNTTVLPMVDGHDYGKVLADADILLIAYNFDEESQRYVGVSMANKLPECLASGATVLAYGPKSFATIGYLLASDCSVVITEQNSETLTDTLREIYSDTAGFQRRAHSARTLVEARHTKARAVSAFRYAMLRAVGSNATKPAELAVHITPPAWTEQHSAKDSAETFAEANELFRKHQYAEALRIYEKLHAKHPLKIYEDNAARARSLLQ